VAAAARQLVVLAVRLLAVRVVVVLIMALRLQQILLVAVVVLAQSHRQKLAVPAVQALFISGLRFNYGRTILRTN
jgi:hypothetical protein